MAKTKKTKADKDSVKHYALGDGATNFVDIKTGKKIAGDQVVAFDLRERKSERFKLALKNGHIEEVDPDDFEAEEVDEDEEDEFAEEKGKFAALTVDKMREFLKDEYEFNEDQTKEIDGLTKPKLIEKYAELLEAE